MFSSATYSQRRNTLLEGLRAQHQRGLLLFLGNEESAMNYADNGYSFRQDSSFLYYFGLDQPGLAALLDLDEGGAILFADDLTIADQHAANPGVGRSRPQPTLRELQGARHHAVVDGGKSHFVSDAGETSRMAREKASTSSKLR